jgi:hypothetical protein
VRSGTGSRTTRLQTEGLPRSGIPAAQPHPTPRYRDIPLSATQGRWRNSLTIELCSLAYRPNQSVVVKSKLKPANGEPHVYRRHSRNHSRHCFDRLYHT